MQQFMDPMHALLVPSQQSSTRYLVGCRFSLVSWHSTLASSRTLFHDIALKSVDESSVQLFILVQILKKAPAGRGVQYILCSFIYFCVGGSLKLLRVCRFFHIFR